MKCSPKLLQLHLNSDKNLVDHWISLLPLEIQEETRKELPSSSETARYTVKLIRNLIVAKYLSWKFDASLEEAHKAVTRSIGSWPLALRCIFEMVDILQNNVGLGKSQVESQMAAVFVGLFFVVDLVIIRYFNPSTCVH